MRLQQLTQQPAFNQLHLSEISNYYNIVLDCTELHTANTHHAQLYLSPVTWGTQTPTHVSPGWF